MDETPRIGPFEPFTFRDELILDIVDMVSFLETQLNIVVSVGDLRGMSDAALDAEYNKVCRFLFERLRRGRQTTESTEAVSMLADDRIRFAGAHYSPQNGLHISESSG